MPDRPLPVPAGVAAKPEPILPPATIGVLGGGQLGRMLAIAARAMGYGVVVLDPDPRCPAAGVADRVIEADYDDVEGARALAEASAVVTYELEHVALDVARAIDERLALRPGVQPLAVTQDRLAERRFLEDLGVRVAPWREVRTGADLATAADALGLPIRLKATRGGYDGRSQVRVATADDVDSAFDRLARPAGEPALAERELAFRCELSVVVARALDGTVRPYPVSQNTHDEGILVESVAPAPIPAELAGAAQAIAERIAVGCRHVGVLTVELFLLGDGTLVANEVAPRVHNSGHWTIEGADTSQFAQHVRAICGLPLGSVAADRGAAMVNLLGTGPRREAGPAGLAEALAESGAAVHLYGKRDVFERRKMGHVTALASDGDLEAALARARAAATRLRWT